MDIVSAKKRSEMMSGIKGRNTRPEMLVRSYLHAKGFRFRLHLRDLPGSPDLVLPKYRACIFVHGCFWHRHQGCRYATTPATRADFWEQKLEGNVTRDHRNVQLLLEAGWRVLIVWECGLRQRANLEDISNWLVDAPSRFLEWPCQQSEPRDAKV
jgi:DNA mismatch endonuclease (patch repair protein)